MYTAFNFLCSLKGNNKSISIKIKLIRCYWHIFFYGNNIIQGLRKILKYKKKMSPLQTYHSDIPISMGHNYSVMTTLNSVETIGIVLSGCWSNTQCRSHQSKGVGERERKRGERERERERERETDRQTDRQTDRRVCSLSH